MLASSDPERGPEATLSPTTVAVRPGWTPCHSAPAAYLIPPDPCNHGLMIHHCKDNSASLGLQPLAEFQASGLLGPRQSGKSTLAPTIAQEASGGMRRPDYPELENPAEQAKNEDAGGDLRARPDCCWRPEASSTTTFAPGGKRDNSCCQARRRLNS